MTESATLTVIPPPVYIFITSPSDGSVINKDDTTITGTVITKAQEVGITVNGETATVYGNQFIANKVPLTEGSNRIVAKAMDSNGATAEAKIIINAAPTVNSVTLTSNIESGTGPLEVTFSVDSSIELTAANTYISYTNPTQVELLTAAPNEYKARINAEGIYDFIVQATDRDGSIYQDSISITVLNKAEIDNLLKAKWEGMKVALKNGDTTTAATYILDSHSSKYKEVFDTLKDQLPAIFSQTEDFVLVFVSDNRAEYENIVVEDGTAYSYPVIFVKDENGLWKIRQF